MIELEIVTPQRKLFKVNCESVTLPGLQGEFEVLEGHAPLLAALKTGVSTLHKASVVEQETDLLPQKSEKFRLMTAEGFAEVSQKKVTVLSEAAALPSEVDIKSEQTLIKQLQNKLDSITDQNQKDFKVAEAEIERATARINIV